MRPKVVVVEFHDIFESVNLIADDRNVIILTSSIDANKNPISTYR